MKWVATISQIRFLCEKNLYSVLVPNIQLLENVQKLENCFVVVTVMMYRVKILFRI